MHCREDAGLLQLRAQLQLDKREWGALQLPGRVYPGRPHHSTLVPGRSKELLAASPQEA